MDNKEAHSIVSSALEALGTALERGQSTQLQRYLRAMGRFHRYSARNLLLILSQQPDARQVAGYHSWRKLGRHVKRAARGILILAPIVQRDRDDTSETATTESAATTATTPDDVADVVGFRYAYVFDISQTAGRPLPALPAATGEPQDWLARLRQVITASGTRIEQRASLAGADGMATGGTIVLRSGLTPAVSFATLVHEWAHELLHFGDDRSAIDRSRRETEAEAVAFVVCEAVGLESQAAVRDYIHLHGGSTAVLTQSLERIRGAAHHILTDLFSLTPRAAAGTGDGRRPAPARAACGADRSGP